MTDLEKQAQKCVNEFVERADGNWTKALGLWREELRANPYGPKFAQYVRSVNLAFKEMGPK